MYDFDSLDSKYNIIIGRDILNSGFILDHKNKNITCDGITINMIRQYFPSEKRKNIQTHFCSFENQKDIMATEIKDALYERISTEEVAKECKHIVPKDRKNLANMLSQFQKLFYGTLEKYKHQAFKIELQDPNCTPIFCPPFSIPRIHAPTFQKELEHLVN